MEEHWYIETNEAADQFVFPAGKTRKQAEDQMRYEWRTMSPAKRTAVRGRDYENKARDLPYMQAVGHNGQCIYDSFTLAELIEADSQNEADEC